MTTEDNTPAANGNQPSTVPHRSHRRAEPITKLVAKNGTLAYKFRAALSTKPDGRRDRRRFTCRTLPEARKELRRIMTEVTAGIYVKSSTMTVDQACDQWLDSRRGICRVSLDGYRNDLKPVRRFLGGKKLQQPTQMTATTTDLANEQTGRRLGRADTGRHRSHRIERSLRRAGARGPDRMEGRSARRAAQPERLRHLARASGRCHRRPHPGDRRP